MVGIGLVGIGFMGMIHFLAAQRIRGGRVVAICSRDSKKLAGDWTSIQGNFGPSGQLMDLTGLAAHLSFEALLADGSVNLVDLCVPNDQHAELAIRAFEAGKHVLVEKPIALDVADADRMIAAANAAGRMLLVAHVLPFFPEFALALDIVRSEKYGQLRGAHFTRVISKPDWSSAIGDADRTGGPAIDLHIHDTHLVNLMVSSPVAVHSRGVVEAGAVVHLTTQYLFNEATAPAVSAISGALVQKGRPFAHGFELYLDEATLSLGIAHLPEQGALNPLALILGDRVEHPALASADPIDAFALELTAAVNSLEGALVPALDCRLARHALATCWAEVESVKLGRAVPILASPFSSD
jgi:predicted dehydrogenase